MIFFYFVFIYKFLNKSKIFLGNEVINKFCRIIINIGHDKITFVFTP
jgi:hypothetical protein